MKINHLFLKLLIFCYCSLIRITPSFNTDCELVGKYHCSWVNMTNKQKLREEWEGCIESLSKGMTKRAPLAPTSTSQECDKELYKTIQTLVCQPLPCEMLQLLMQTSASHQELLTSKTNSRTSKDQTMSAIFFFFFFF